MLKTGSHFYTNSTDYILKNENKSKQDPASRGTTCNVLKRK